MSKDEFLKLLLQKGYMATNESGVIIIEYPQGKFNYVYKELKAIMKEARYEASIGFRSSGKVKSNPDKVEEYESEENVVDINVESEENNSESMVYDIIEDENGQMSLF